MSFLHGLAVYVGAWIFLDLAPGVLEVCVVCKLVLGFQGPNYASGYNYNIVTVIMIRIVNFIPLRFLKIGSTIKFCFMCVEGLVEEEKIISLVDISPSG